MEITPGMKITPDMLGAGSANQQGPVASSGSAMGVIPGMKITPEMLQSVPEPTETGPLSLSPLVEPTAGLIENVANQVTQLGAMAAEVPNALGSIGGELVDSIVNQRLPTINNIAQRMETGHQVMSPLIYQPQTESGQHLQESIGQVMTSIPAMVDSLDDLHGANFKKNFPNIYASVQASGELLPFMLLGKAIHGGLETKIDNPLLTGEDAQLERARLSVRQGPKPERPELGVQDVAPSEVIPEVGPTDVELAQSVAKMASSPVMSVVDEAATLADQISKIEEVLSKQQLTPETQAELGRLTQERERLSRKYSELTTDFQGESSELPLPSVDEPANPVTVPDLNGNSVSDPQFLKGMEEHFSKPSEPDNLVYSSSKMLAHANLVEDLLLSSGVKSKVALFDLSDLESHPDLASALEGHVSQAFDRLNTTKNYGVVKQIPNPDGGMNWVAIINSKEIAKGGGAKSARVLEAALHEAYGHVVVGEKYAWASDEMKAALQKDFQRFSKLDGAAAAKEFYPLKTGEIAIGVPEMPEGQLFKEWLVNGVVKWVTSSAEPVGLANKWFAKIAGVFKKAWAATEVKPAESIKQWMESIFDSKRLLDAPEKPVAPVKDVEAHTAPKKLSINKQMERLRSAVSKEDLAGYEVGKVEGAGDNTIAVYKKRNVYATDKEGRQYVKRVERTHLQTFISTSRSTVRREAELFRYAHALASRGLVETPARSARFDYYRGLLSEVEKSGTLREIAEDRGTTPNQVWLDFLADPQSFVSFSQEAIHRFARMDEAEGRLFDKVIKAIERDDSAVKRAILVERRVIPESIQELQKAESVLAEELGVAAHPAPLKAEIHLDAGYWPALKETYNKLLERYGAPENFPRDVLGTRLLGWKVEDVQDALRRESAQPAAPVTVPNLNNNFVGRVRSAAEDAVIRYLSTGTKMNLERLQGAVQEKLRLTGADLKEAKKWIKDNYEDLKAGKASVVAEVDARLEEGKVPDDVSLEEAAAYMDLLGDMAVVRKPLDLLLASIPKSVINLVKGTEARAGYKSRMHAAQAIPDSVMREVPERVWNTLPGLKDAIAKEVERRQTKAAGLPEDSVIRQSLVDNLDRAIDTIKKTYLVDYVFQNGIEDMAVRRGRKQTKITGPLYAKLIKDRKKKDLSRDEITERQQKRLAKESEFVEKTSELEQKADEQNVSLTEYLRGTGLEEGEIAKILRKYVRLAKTRFTDSEHVLRLAKNLGLIDEHGRVDGLEAFIKSVFPKAQGPLQQLTITGRDILIKRLQDQYIKQTGDKFDFSKVPTLIELRNLQYEAMKSMSRWEKFKAGIGYFTGKSFDELEVTPAGAELAFLLKNVHTTETSLYTRDYLKRLDQLAKTVTDAQDREHILNVYLGHDVPRNKVFADAAKLMEEIYTSYGQEMEAVGVRIIYKGGYQEKFKFNPDEKFFPHMWEPGQFAKPSEAMLNSLVVSGMKPNAKQAKAIIAQHGRRYQRLSAPRFANLELAREIDMDGWIKDPVKVTAMYVKRSANRLAILREVGQAPETRLAQLAWDHYQQTKDPDSLNFAVKVINATTGVSTHEPLMKKALNFVGAAEFVAMASALQHAALIQPSIASNLITTAGWKNTVKGLYRYIKADPRKASMSRAWADVLGASSRSIGRELLDELVDGNSLASRADKLLSYWKVTSVDRWLRDASTLVGQLHVNDMIERAINLGDKKAELELKRLGLDSHQIDLALKNGDDALVEDYLKKGSYAFAQRTNLATDPLTMPTMHMERTSWGRLLTLFGRFAFHQHHFLRDTVKDNPAKFGKYLMAAGTVGVPIYLARTLAKGKHPAQDYEERGLFGVGWAVLQSGGGLGLFGDAIGEALSSMITGQTSHAQERMGGPLPGMIAETVQGAGQIAHGQVTQAKALRLLLRAGTVGLAGAAPEKWGVPAGAILGAARPAIENILKDTNK